MANRLFLKKGDTVVVLSGKSKGKKGKVLSVIPKAGTALVEGVNMATKHVKPRRQDQLGGIVHQETPVRVCKLMVVCPKCKEAARVGFQVLENGEKVRVCKKCGAEM